MNGNGKLKKYFAFGALFALGVSLAIALVNRVDDFKDTIGENDAYSLSLNSENAVSTSGTYTQVSASGGEVRFKYTSVSSSSGNHCALSEGGAIVNEDVIHSISSFTATFTGTLKARVAYTTDSWGGYFDLVSGQRVDLGNNPYYLEIKATQNTVLSSALYNYSCLVNAEAEVQDTSGSYDITFSSHATDGSSELSAGGVLGEVANGDNYISSFSGVSKVFTGINGLKLGSGSSAGSFTINLKSSSVKNQLTSIAVSAKQYNTDSGDIIISANGGGDGLETTFTATSSGNTGTLSFNSATTVTSITISTNSSSKRAYVSGISLNYGGHVEPGVPSAVEVGFSATDSNKDTYTTNSIFDNDNNLSVYKLDSNGGQTSLAKGQNGYSYVVKNSLNEAIDTSEKFPEEGVYTLYVSYKTYDDIVINLNVGEYVYALDITPSMETATFTTADRLSEHLVNNLSALVNFSNGTTDTVQYSSFALKNLGLRLLTPKGFTYDMNNPFGQEGTWKIIVYRLDDANVSGEFSITVNAILVETITLNETSYQLYPEDTLQLTTTINPNNVTNDSIYWSSNNEDVATVSDSGLVTAVAVGGAKISATAADGSGVVAQCSITVVAKPVAPSYTLITSNSSLKNGDKVVIKTEGGVGVSGFNGTKDATVSETSTSWVEFVIGNASNSGWTLYDSSASKFIASPSGNEFKYSVSGGTCSADGSGHLMCNTRYLCANDSYYRFYGSLGSYTPFFVYKVSCGQAAQPIYPTSIALNGNNSISVGETSQLTTTFNPDSTNVKNVVYTSSNTNVATVSEKGLVTGVSVGNATITATAEAANSETVTATISIQVNAIAVTSISLNQQSASVKAGKTITLSPTILPSNATNKSVNWSTSSSSIATVSNGVVTGVAAGEATITATTVDGNKTATCVLTVTSSSVSSNWELVTDASSLSAGDVIVLASKENGKTNGELSSQILGAVSSTFSNNEITTLNENTVQLTLGGSIGAWTLSNDEGELLGATAVKKLAWDSGTTTWSISVANNGDATIQNGTESYGKFLYNTGSPRFTTYTSAASSSMPLPQIYRGGTAEPVDPTSILMSDSSIELAPNGTKNLSVSYIPSNANQNKDVTWTSSNTNVATVTSEGQVSVKGTATVGQTATITAKLTNLPSITATCLVTVVEKQLDDHTVMIYMCGADLESENGLASGDIKEILNVSGQPDDVNIIIETGGASKWNSSYGIDANKLQRWHVENKSLVKDETLSTYTSMGLTSTFQSFLEWGLTNYPAQRTGVVLWNHGGGMHGVCYDEKKNDDSLLNSEVSTAVKNAFTNTGRSTSDKLEWIGYDACLMSVQDIAEFNSKYFNYQISSEESEAGYGWDYDNWVDNLYNKQTTTTILKEICDTFIKDNGGVNYNGDQTLSYLDLSYANAYKTAWENMVSQLSSKLTSSNKSSFNSAITGNVKHYADDDYDYFCLFDAKDFINKLASSSAFSSFRIDSSYTDAVITELGRLVAYSTCQKGAGNSNGICMYWTNSSQYSDIDTYYTKSQTNFAVWQGICNKYGTHK